MREIRVRTWGAAEVGGEGGARRWRVVRRASTVGSVLDGRRCSVCQAVRMGRLYVRWGVGAGCVQV